MLSSGSGLLNDAEEENYEIEDVLLCRDRDIDDARFYFDCHLEMVEVCG